MTKPDKPHYLGHRKRLREKLVDNSRSLADYELLELLLAQVFTRKDTKPLAKAVLDSALSGTAKAPDVIVATGDLVQDETAAGYERFRDLYVPDAGTFHSL